VKVSNRRRSARPVGTVDGQRNQPEWPCCGAQRSRRRHACRWRSVARDAGERVLARLPPDAPPRRERRPLALPRLTGNRYTAGAPPYVEQKARRKVLTQERSVMAPYSIFAVGPNGHFVWAKEIMGSSDAAALERARQLLDQLDLEVWSGGRKIAGLSARRRTPSPTSCAMAAAARAGRGLAIRSRPRRRDSRPTPSRRVYPRRAQSHSAPRFW
jgi:hypothetical protein